MFKILLPLATAFIFFIFGCITAVAGCGLLLQMLHAVWSLSVLITLVNSAKMAQPTTHRFGVLTWVGHQKAYFSPDTDPPWHPYFHQACGYLPRPVLNSTAWWQRHMGVKNLPTVVTRQRGSHHWVTNPMS